MAAAPAAAIAIGQPELIPVATMAAKTAGMYLDDPTKYQKDPKQIGIDIAKQAVQDQLGVKIPTPKVSPSTQKSTAKATPQADYVPPQRSQGRNALENEMESFIQRYGEEALANMVEEAKRATGTARPSQLSGSGIYTGATRGYGLGAGIYVGKGTNPMANHGIEISHGGHRSSMLGGANVALKSRPELEMPQRFTNIPRVFLKK